MSEEELKIINAELDQIFRDSNFSANSSISYCLYANNRKVIPSASISIFSINILEKVIDTLLIIKKFLGNNYQNLVLTSVEIWQDENEPREMI